MATQTKSSALRAIIEKVYTATTLEEGIKITLAFLEDPKCAIWPNERHIMSYRTKTSPSLLRLQTYLTNSLLRWEGMGL